MFDEVDEQDETVVTSHNLICGHPIHQREHTIAMFSRPIHTAFADFLLAAQQEGWRYDGNQGYWLCATCTPEATA